jgi:hypothetical protein
VRGQIVPMYPGGYAKAQKIKKGTYYQCAYLDFLIRKDRLEPVREALREHGLIVYPGEKERTPVTWLTVGDFKKTYVQSRAGDYDDWKWVFADPPANPDFQEELLKNYTHMAVVDPVPGRNTIWRILKKVLSTY